MRVHLGGSSSISDFCCVDDNIGQVMLHPLMNIGQSEEHVSGEVRRAGFEEPCGIVDREFHSQKRQGRASEAVQLSCLEEAVSSKLEAAFAAHITPHGVDFCSVQELKEHKHGK